MTGAILWSYPTGERVLSVAPTGDLDGDRSPDVVAGTQNTTSNVVVHVISAGVAFFSDGFDSGDTAAWTSTLP